MKTIKMRGISAAVTGALLIGFGANAMADSTTDIVNALVAKGVLTEEEGALLNKGREMESAGQAKAIKKASKLKVSDAIDNATLYGDVRVRHETRKGSSVAGEDQTRDRERYKLTLGIKTESGSFYSDLALAMGSQGRSDNATFGGTKNMPNGENDKETAYIKRAMVGWKATDWLALEAGRMANPLYTTSMVWDGDLTFEGLVEKANFKLGDAKIFLNGVQSQYLGDKKRYDGATADQTTNWIMAFQAGLEAPISDDVKAKVAATYTTYSNNARGGIFVPKVNATTLVTGTSYGTNDLRTIEIPAEVSFKTAGPLSYTVFGDYVYNLDGGDRRDAACVLNASYCHAKDDSAWMFGAGIVSKAGKTAATGDWSAKVWYQDVGVYAVDPNAVDSDFMDSKVNIKGTVFKAEYVAQENVFVNLSAGYGKRKNKDYETAGVSGDTGVNLKDYQLYQLDLTYKF